MNLSSSKGSMSTSTWKSPEVVSNQFPAGLRVLVVDDDPACLMIVERMLKKCLYEVTTCNRAEAALSSLQANRNGFDIVISDVHMPDMDGFKLLELIGLEMDLPVIMMSADDGKQVVMKGVTHGACDYLIKPIRIEELKNIWQHVVRKRKNEWKEMEQSASVEEGVGCGDRGAHHNKQSEEADYSSSANEGGGGGNWKGSKRRKDEEDEMDERDDSSTLKKPRVVWSVELHQQFVAAVNQLGIDKAVPKKILELMNVPGLTRENVASHLQKYRLYLRRLSGVSPHHQGGVSASFIGTQDATFCPMSSLTGLDIQALAVSGQLLPQSLATLQAAGYARPSQKLGQSTAVFDQRNLFSFDISKFKIIGEGQQSQQQNNLTNSKQMNLLHGIPTTMEPKQLASLHQSFENMGNSVLMHRGAAHLPSSLCQPVTLNAVSQTTSSAASLTFPMSQGIELPGANSFPSPPGIPNSTQKGTLQENVNAGITGGYFGLNDLHQVRSNGWELQSSGLAFDSQQNASSSLPGNLESPAPTLYAQQGVSRSGSVRNNNSTSGGSRVRLPMEGGSRNENLSSVVNSSVRIKSENVADVGFGNSLYPEHFGQEDLMSALLKQQEVNIGPANPEFDFDGYSIDNIPV